MPLFTGFIYSKYAVFMSGCLLVFFLMNVTCCSINGNGKKCSQGAFSDLSRGEVLPGNIICEDVQKTSCMCCMGRCKTGQGSHVGACTRSGMSPTPCVFLPPRAL